MDHDGHRQVIFVDEPRLSSRPQRGPPSANRESKAALLVQCSWRGFSVRRDLDMEEQYLASIVIQALFRGHLIRMDMWD